MTGLHLAHYRIDAELGRGGMGIVYRATDTKLNRSVALKVLPAAALSSEEDRARFFREAQAAAQLHHPNIATVFQIDEAIPVDADGKEVQGSDGPRPFIAMEFVEGETLADTIRKGPVKLQVAVSIAGQVAEALKEAHAKQIVHRDIKSANVMLTEEGVAKVLDFGLAKTNQSTMLTRMGSTLGTVAYMSPEQARGQEVDSRTDLYSLGTMLYEMVAGRLPFAGDYEQAVLYGILNESPEPLTSLRTGVPMELERIVVKLLSKEAEYRYQTAGDLLADLKSLDVSGSGISRRSMPAMSASHTTAAAGATRGRIPAWFWGAAAGVAVLTAFGGWLARPVPQDDRPVRRLAADFSPASAPIGRIALSADGRAMATISLEELGLTVVVRFFDEPESRVLAQTGSAFPPALSPDGRWVAYHLGDLLYRVSTSGGSPEVIADLDGGFVTWLSADELVSDSSGSSLHRVRVSGGTERVPLDVPDSRSVGHLFAVPGTTVVLFTLRDPETGEKAIHSVDLESGSTREIMSRASWPRYHDGYLLFFRNGDVHGATFDPHSMEVGPTFLVNSGVGQSGDGWVVHYDVSQTDLMALYFGSEGAELGGRELRLVSAEGQSTPVDVERNAYWDPRFSPDGRLILTHAASSDGGSDIWLVDPARRTTRRMTRNPREDETAIWAPGGTHFYYSANGDSTEYVLRQSIDGSTPVDTLFEIGGHIHVESVSSDDRFVVAMVRSDETGPDLWLLDRTDPSAARTLLAGNAEEMSGKISPDGRFIAYMSNESGRSEVYVAQFPTMLGIQTVSADGGSTPVWSRDGDTLFYMTDSELLKVDFSGGAPGAVELAMDLPAGTYRSGGHTTYDVLDGGFVLLASRGGDSSYSEVQVISGLGTLLRSLDPAVR